MDIILNDRPFNVTLENEKTLGDVMEGIEKWLKNNGFQITSLRKNGREVNLPEKLWKSFPVESVNDLHITALNAMEIKARELQTLHQYFSLLYKALEAGNLPLISDLMGEYPFIRDSIDQIMTVGYEKYRYAESLDYLVSKSKLTPGTGTISSGIMERSSCKELQKFLENMLLIVVDRIVELTSPLEELNKTVLKMNALVPEIIDISVLLQTGKDREAMALIILFTELFEKVIRLFQILKEKGLPALDTITVEGDTFDVYSQHFNSILSELTEGFDAGDSVLIGDLMEYEVAPKIGQLMEFIKKIMAEESSVLPAEGA